MDWTFERCKGAIPIADDIQMFGTDDNHDTFALKQWIESEVQEFN